MGNTYFIGCQFGSLIKAAKILQQFLALLIKKSMLIAFCEFVQNLFKVISLFNVSQAFCSADLY